MKSTIALAVAAGLWIAACAPKAPDASTAVANDVAANDDFNGGSVLTNGQGDGDVTTVPADETADDRNIATDQENGTAAATTVP